MNRFQNMDHEEEWITYVGFHQVAEQGCYQGISFKILREKTQT